MKKKLARFLIILFGACTALLGASFLLFYLKRDWVERKLFQLVENRQQGEIRFGDIYFSPLSHLPKIAIRLEDVYYYEHPADERPADEKPILQVKTAYVAFNALALLRGKIDVSALTLADGEFNLIFYPDNSLNLVNAFGMGQAALQNTADGAEPPPDADLRLDGITLKNLTGWLDHQGIDMKTEIRINAFSAGFEYRQQVDNINLAADLVCEQLVLNEKAYLHQKKIRLDLDFTLDEKTMLSRIGKSALSFEGIAFDLSGTYAFDHTGWADLTLDASDKGMGLLSLLVEEEILDRNMDLLKKGNLFFKGDIKGQTINHLPLISFAFGAERIQLDIPGRTEPIKDLRFNGYFSTGEADDLSESEFQLNNLEATLPGGYIKANLAIRNFFDPVLTAGCDLKMNVEGMEHVFKLGKTDSLAGQVEFSAHIENQLYTRNEDLFAGSDNLRLNLRDLAFHRPGFARRFERINGLVRNQNGQVALHGITLRFGHSDMTVQGRLLHIGRYLFDRETGIGADLQLKAGKLILQEWPFFDTLSHPIARETVTDLDVDLSLRLRPGRSNGRRRIPDGMLAIRHARARLDRLPDIEQLTGTADLRESPDGSIRMVIEKLDLLLPFGAIGIRNGLVRKDSASLSGEGVLQIRDVRLHRMRGLFGPAKRVAYPATSDTTQVLNALLPAAVSYHCGTNRLDSLSVEGGTLRYRFRDTGLITLKGMEVQLKELLFTKTPDGSPRLASLTGSIAVQQMQSNRFRNIGFDCQLEGRSDFYAFRGALRQGSGVKEEGTIEVDLSGEEPALRLTYSLKEFPMETLLGYFFEKKILRGPVSLSVDLATQGSKPEEWLPRARGRFVMKGASLTLEGIDLDGMLRQYRTEQRFRLAGLSACFLAGPLGAVAARGMDNARLMSGSPSPAKRTKIPAFISSWTFADGIVQSHDVALATPFYRVALNGWINLPAERIGQLTVSVVDEKGCSLVEQTLSGSFGKPVFGAVRLAGDPPDGPVEVRKLRAGPDCLPAYKGAVGKR